MHKHTTSEHKHMNINYQSSACIKTTMHCEKPPFQMNESNKQLMKAVARIIFLILWFHDLQIQIILESWPVSRYQKLISE